MNRFIKFLTTSILIILTNICFISFSQDDVIPKLKPYEDLSIKLYSSKVIEMSGKSKLDLKTSFKNWGSTTFANLKEVIVSETDDQIVLVYIEKIPVIVKTILGLDTSIWSMYVRMIAEFKEGKMRVSIYDDGNAFRPSDPITYTPAYPDRIFHISKYQTPPTSSKELLKKGCWYVSHIKWEEKCDNTLLSVENAIKNPTSISPLRKDDF